MNRMMRIEIGKRWMAVRVDEVEKIMPPMPGCRKYRLFLEGDIRPVEIDESVAESIWDLMMRDDSHVANRFAHRQATLNFEKGESDGPVDAGAAEGDVSGGNGSTEPTSGKS